MKTGFSHGGEREREAGLFSGGEQLVRHSVRIHNKVNRECSVRQEIVRERAQNRTKESCFIIMTLPLFIQNKDSYNG